MSSSSSLTDTICTYSPLAGEAVKRFRQQPGLRSTASAFVAVALARLQPPITLDPDDVSLGWPPGVTPTGATEHIALPDLLIDLFARQGVLTIVPGYQVALRRRGQEWVPLDVNLIRLAQELDAVRPSLEQAFIQSLAEFWSETDATGKTHWAWMGDYLRQAFRQALEAARLNNRLSTEAYLAGLAIIATGNHDNRPRQSYRASLVQLEHNGGAMPFDSKLDPHLLITLGRGADEHFLAFSPIAGLRCFASRAALLDDFSRRLDNDQRFTTASVRRVSVEGDVFNALARALLQTQLIQVGRFHAMLQDIPNRLTGDRLRAASDALTGFFLLDAHVQVETHRWLQLGLPRWLREASSENRWHYAATLAHVALSQPLVGRSWFLDGIPTLETYALDRLREEAALEHPEAPWLEPSNLDVFQVYAVDDLLDITGGPTHASLREDPVRLTDLAIDNLSAHSRGWLKVQAKPGTTVPAWLDGDALTALVRRVDVGGRYPRLLRERLLTGPQAAEREKLFCDQVVLQLPLLAWELVLRAEGALDYEGYRLIKAGLGARPVEDTTRLMGLGVTAGGAYGIDPIAATYVFVREDELARPCVLYRPLHSDPLRQYSSLDALWEDLSAPGDLQDEALRWMTDLGRTRYSHGGWREPRVRRFGQGDEFAPLERAKPARPALLALATPVVNTVYRQIVEALVNMAERRSVSNAEDHWISLGNLAWTLFNSVLPLFNGPLSAVGWLVQLTEQFAEYLKVSDTQGGDSDEARNDLLFSIVLLLVSEGVRWPIDERGSFEAEREVDGVAEGEGGAERGSGDEATPSSGAGSQRPKLDGSIPAQMSLTLTEQFVGERELPAPPLALDLSWASPDLALSPQAQQALASLRARPPLSGLQPIPHGPSQGLYLYENRLLVNFKGHFYAVNLEGEAPRIVGPQGEVGPYLRRDEAGRWVLDLRLGLRGGGPKRRIEARRRQNEQDREQAEQLFNEAVPAFEAVRDRANPLAEELDMAAQRKEPQPAKRKVLDAVLNEGHDRCAGFVDRYQALNNATPLTDFAERFCSLLARLLNISKARIENLSELTHEFLQTSPLFGISAAELEKRRVENPSSWTEFLEAFEKYSEQTVTYVQAHQRTVERIEVFPGLGARTLEGLAPSVSLSVSLPELWSSLAYCRLCQVLESLRGAPLVSEEVYNALEPVLVHSSSHADAADDMIIATEEKIRVFDTAILHYQRAEDAARAFSQTLAPEHRSEALVRFEAVTASLRKDAERRMGELIRAETSEQAGPSRSPRRPPARTRPRQPTKPVTKPGSASSGAGQGTQSGASTGASGNPQVIRTADGESVMARIRTLSDSQGSIAEVHANGRVLASWRQDSPGAVWRKPEPVPKAPGPESNGRLNALVREADQVASAAERELQQATRLKQATRIPADIEDLYHSRAQRLETLADQIERALTRMNVTDAVTEDHGSAQVKALQLREQAGEARRVGTAARIDLSKSLMPTAGRVDFLLQAGEITIRRLGRRTPLKRDGRRDFVQEYEIVDRQNHPLWYAHFHYDTVSAAPERYTAAHLKTVTQRFDGYQRQLEQARNDQEVVSIYRSRIDPVLARKLFLPLT